MTSSLLPTPAPRRKGPIILAWALSVLVLVALVAATLSVIALRGQHTKNQDRAAAMQAARQLALDFTTYDYKTWDADTKRVLNDSTGQFKDEFAAGANQVKSEVVTNQATSTGEVVEAAVVSNDKDSAQVLVIANAVVTNTAAKDGVQRRYRIKLDLVREKDRWLTADFQVVG